MLAPQGFGVFSYDLSHLLGGAALVLSFALLYQRRLAAVIQIYAVAGLRGRGRRRLAGFRAARAAPLYITALIAFGAKGVLIPVVASRASSAGLTSAARSNRRSAFFRR